MTQEAIKKPRNRKKIESLRNEIKAIQEAAGCKCTVEKKSCSPEEKKGWFKRLKSWATGAT